jgi:hypothetical protein
MTEIKATCAVKYTAGTSTKFITANIAALTKLVIVTGMSTSVIVSTNTS